MAAKIIDGARIARFRRARMAEEVAELKRRGVTPGLAVVIVGDDPASQVYVRNKHRACEEVGIRSFQHELPAETSQQELLAVVSELNADSKVDGILVQLPLPDHIDEDAVIDAISPDKDVDGFHTTSVGRLVVGKPGFRPCTPAGCMALLEDTGVDVAGKEVVVVGRSNIVGKPISFMLLEKHATVTVCHSRTKDLPEIIRRADVVIAAVGRPRMIQGDWLKPGAVVIDVGINRTDDGLVGDVDFASAVEVASAITPVPGGVGPMTIAMLLENAIASALNANRLVGEEGL